MEKGGVWEFTRNCGNRFPPGRKSGPQSAKGSKRRTWGVQKKKEKKNNDKGRAKKRKGGRRACRGAINSSLTDPVKGRKGGHGP